MWPLLTRYYPVFLTTTQQGDNTYCIIRPVQSKVVSFFLTFFLSSFQYTNTPTPNQLELVFSFLPGFIYLFVTCWASALCPSSTGHRQHLLANVMYIIYFVIKSESNVTISGAQFLNWNRNQFQNDSTFAWNLLESESASNLLICAIYQETPFCWLTREKSIYQGCRRLI